MKTYSVSDSTNHNLLSYLSEIEKSRPDITFSWLLEDIYDHDSQLLTNEVFKQSINISSGVSAQTAYIGFLNKITDDILRHKYYREYSAAQGNYNLRRFIALTENSRSDKLNYELDDICITEGASGAISSIIEYIKNCFSSSEIIIPVPSYYGYRVSAIHHNIKYKEVILTNSLESPAFSSLKSIINAINKHTKLIAITYPDNPSGLLYQLDEIKQLLKIARMNDILVIFDEVFIDLLFNEVADNIDLVAQELSASKNIVIIRSYSKNHNLPGFRAGYALSKNSDLMRYLAKIQESRVLFAAGSSIKGLFYLDGVFKIIDNSLKKNPDASLDNVIDQISNNEVANKINKVSKKKLLENYHMYQNYKTDLLNTYSESYDLTVKLLHKSCEEMMPKVSAFNTFVKFKDMKNVNMFDFCINLFLSTGLKIALGPYFGLTQREWENNSQLGFWLRITFGVDKEDLNKGIKTLLAFIDIYTKKRGNFVKVNRYY